MRAGWEHQEAFVPEPVALTLSLAQNEVAAVWLDCFRVDPDSIRFFFHSRRRVAPTAAGGDPRDPDYERPHSDIVLRVAFPDGATAAAPADPETRRGDPSEGISLWFGSGTLGWDSDREVMIAPLPSAGAVLFSIESSELELSGSAMCDGELFLDGARAAKEVFAEDG